MSALVHTAREFQCRAAEHDTVLVAFSGGKDSLVVEHLARRYFRRVVAFHLDLVPGLAVVAERVDGYLGRVGVPVAHYPDPVALAALRDGVFCDPRPEYDDLPRLTHADVYRLAAADAGVPLAATADGKKESDFHNRALHLRSGRAAGWHPLARWTKADVVGYLRRAGIPLPESHAEAGGIDLTRASLCWLHDRHPADFRKLLEWFPYAEAVVRRRDWFPAAHPVRPVRQRGGAPPGHHGRPVQPADDHR
jgi:phosphoadenosine phosphosulfate reductase